MEGVEHITPTPIQGLPTLMIPDAYTVHDSPIIIDNGSTTFRFGFASANSPHTVANVMSRFKEKRHQRPVLLFGEGTDLDSSARNASKTAWEGDVLLNFDALESALDYAFIKLGINTVGAVEHPIVMTERLCSPLYSRASTSEMLFEAYTIPSVVYPVDSLMSFYYNNPSHPLVDGLVISFNTASTSVIPVLDGRGILSHAKRIPWGAAQSAEFLLKLIQIKYPFFPIRVAANQASWMLHHFCEFSSDFTQTIRNLADPLKLRADERIVQFPFTAIVESEKTEQEIARLAQKRKEQGRRLQEIAAGKRLEKLMQTENDLQYLLDLKERKSGEKKSYWLSRLEMTGFETEQALDEEIKRLELILKKARKKEAAEGDILEDPTFPLLDVPDIELDEDGLKEKRKQKLMKAGYEARMRARKEKEREKEAREQDEQREKDERENDPAGWAARMRMEHEVTIQKIKDRQKRKAALGDRKSALAQARMRSIATLASEMPTGKKKRKMGNEEKGFGDNEEDWAIYRKINSAVNSSSEDEDHTNLMMLESRLLTHDPTFTAAHTYAARAASGSALMTSFIPPYDEGDPAGSSRIHLNIERWRVPETWFNPGIAGVDSAGLGEVMAGILTRFGEEDKARLVKNVLLTGSPANLPKLAERVHLTLRPILSPEMEMNIGLAANPNLDAWYGMAKFSQTSELGKFSITRAEYQEWGGERIKRWWGGNWNKTIAL